ncbi:MAG: hypothetical protein HDR71_12790 [Lachnospiraceae bacterium]|nr:hypothetical protein [Lachnospiraceae bacterium]
MKNKITIVFLLLSVIFCAGCGAKKDTTAFSDLSRRIIKLVEENNEIFYSAEDIVIDSISYGSFSMQGANEALVLCKFLNMPHVGGLDRTAAVILSVDSMEMVSYNEFGADEVSMTCLKTNSGEVRIFFIGTSASTGMSGQSVKLFAIRDGKWEELPLDALEELNEDCFCFMQGDNTLIFTANTGLAELTDSSEILAVYRWNPDTEQFTRSE